MTSFSVRSREPTGCWEPPHPLLLLKEQSCQTEPAQRPQPPPIGFRPKDSLQAFKKGLECRKGRWNDHRMGGGPVGLSHCSLESLLAPPPYPCPQGSLLSSPSPALTQEACPEALTEWGWSVIPLGLPDSPYTTDDGPGCDPVWGVGRPGWESHLCLGLCDLGMTVMGSQYPGL